MFSPDQYELLDFGAGRRLERFGELILDRPCPTAEHLAPAHPALWKTADATFARHSEQSGAWTTRRALAERWTIQHGPLAFALKRTEFGHVGLFPEQAANWAWVAAQVGDAIRRHGAAPRVLNLFAYTGGSTLAAAAAGAEVTHVDAAKNVVAWARGNAAQSQMAEAPIRWITEEALKFVKRELRRGSVYDAVILDPPSYGHGPRGEVWRLAKHLPRLLELCAELTAAGRRFVLLTCHTPSYDVERLKRLVAETLGDNPAGKVTGEAMYLRTAAGRALPSGACVKWEGI